MTYFTKIISGLDEELNKQIIEEYPIQDSVWPSRRWKPGGREFADLSGTRPIMVLCTRNIEAGDTFYIKGSNEPRFATSIKEDLIYSGPSSLRYPISTAFKIVGEVSAEAEEFLQDGEFIDESDVREITTLGKRQYQIYEVKGPCGHFH